MFTGPIIEISTGKGFFKRVLTVHKTILVAHSTFFANALKGGFLESNTGKFDLEEESSEIVAVVIR